MSEEDVSTSRHSALFPSSSDPMITVKIINETSLFPAADDDNPGKQTTSGLKWLTNQSYSAEAASTFHSRYQASLEEEESLTESDDSEKLPLQRANEKTFPEKEIKKSKRKKKSRERSRSPIKTRKEIERELIAQKSKKIFIEDVGLNPEHAFRVDRKSDRNILAFRSMYHLHIAQYFSKKRCWPLGVDSKVITGWLNSTKNKRRRLSSCRYFSEKNAVKLISEEDVLDFTKHHLIYDFNKFRKKISFSGEYIPIEISVNDLAGKTEIDRLSSDSNTKGYFAEAPIKASNHVVDSYKDILEVPKKESVGEYLKRRTAEFNQYLRENPTDESKWLEFLSFQDEMMNLPKSAASDLGHFTEKSLFEKKLAIFDRALETNPKSVKLMVYKLELSKNYWETSKLKKEWKKLTFAYPNDIFVWEHYLLFLQTRYSSFNFTNVVNGYVECFSKLISIHEGKFQSHSRPPELEEKMLGLFSKFCRFLQQTGHNERALALYQAMAEFTFFIPTSVTPQMELQDWLAFFEPFWDSGMPRFGEEGAIGWAEVMKLKQFNYVDDKKKSLDEEEDGIIQQNLTKPETWLKIESLREAHHWLPWKQSLNENDEDGSEDPDRMILFDDIGPFLFRLATVENKFLFAKNFLQFLGVCSNPHPLTYCQNCHCHNALITDALKYPLTMDDQFKYRFSNIRKYLPSTFNLTKIEYPETYFVFVQNVFDKIVGLLPDPFCTELKVIWLQHKRTQVSSLKMLNDPSFKPASKETKKAAKNLLKEEANRNNLSLWYEYCKLEEKFGSSTEVKNILEMILKFNPKVMFSSDSLDQDLNLCKLYRLYAEIEIGIDSVSDNLELKNSTMSSLNNKSVNILATIGAGENYGQEITPSIILKARNRFLNNFNSLLKDYSDFWLNSLQRDIPHSILLHRIHFAIEWCHCYALFQYLTIGLHPACVTYENAIEKMLQCEKNIISTDNKLKNKLQLDLELLYSGYLRLLLHHVNNTTASLKTIRNVLLRALAIFPTSPCLLHLLINIESRSHIAGRLRRHFNHWMQTSQSPVVAVCSLLAEIYRKENLLASSLAIRNCSDLTFATLSEDGISNQISSIFERSTKLAGCQNCPLLWRLYIAFEVKRGNFAKAKAVFYQAVQNCPWVKCLYLDAVKQFPGDTDEILDILTEKEIRLRIPLEEVDLLMGLVTKAKELSQTETSLSTDMEISLPADDVLTS